MVILPRVDHVRFGLKKENIIFDLTYSFHCCLLPFGSITDFISQNLLSKNKNSLNMKLFQKFYMPFLTGPECVIGECGVPDFPQSVDTCSCELAQGGINELYFIPCTETFTEANVIDPSWWQTLLDNVGSGSVNSGLGRSGPGLGSIARKDVKTERTASCRTPQLTSITWALKFGIKCFDKTSARTTCGKMNELILHSDKYLVVARMCDGDEVVLPIGTFNTSDFNWTVPDNFEEIQLAEFELSWKELGFPCTVYVPGLCAVLPKLS